MKITITTGTGSGPTALAAFDAALLQSGVGNYNLIPLSSVIPPSSELQQDCYTAPVSEFGHRLYVVISSQQATEPGAEAWAGLGWVQDTSGKGLFVEHHGLNEAGVSQDIHRSLSAMVANRSHDQYGSIVYVAFNDHLAGILELQPTVRPETQEVINALHARGLELAIISGDHTEPTQALARAVGIDRFFAEVLPQDKAALVESLEKEGRCVCFVGDGINDAIALKQATVSVSLSGATTAATDTAQVVLMNGSLEHLPHLFEIGERFKRNMRGNLVAAFGPALTSMGGIFFFGTGVPLAIIMYNVSVAGSLVNAMLPNVQQSQSVEKHLGKSGTNCRLLSNIFECFEPFCGGRGYNNSQCNATAMASRQRRLRGKIKNDD